MEIPKSVRNGGLGGGVDFTSPEEAKKASAMWHIILLLTEGRELIFYVATLIRGCWNGPAGVFPGHKVDAKLANGEKVHDWREKGF